MNFILNLLKVILYGILQAFTDFIPVGRLGHFTLFDSILTLYPSEFFGLFKNFIRLGSLFAVIIIFKTRLNLFDVHKEKKEKIIVLRLWMKLIFASLPVLILGVIFNSFIFERLNSNLIIGLAMIVFGFILYKVDMLSNKHKVSSIEHVSYHRMLKIGVYQCLALIPGCSSSGIRIIGSLRCGCSRQLAAECDLLLGIPLLLIITVFSFIKYIIMFGFLTFSQCIYIILGILVSFLMSYVIIRLFLTYIKRNSYRIFGIYQMILGAFILIYFYVL